MLCITALQGVPIGAQNDTNTSLQQLDRLISENNYTEANTLVEQSIESLISEERFYDVADYMYYLGKITSELEGVNTSETTILNLLHRVNSLTDDPKALRQMHLEIGSFYETIGNTNAAIKNNLKALEYTKSMPDASGQLFGLIQSNLGVFHSRIGQLEKAIEYHSAATKSYLSDGTTQKNSFYINYNSLGAMMWYQSKMDSALVFFRKAENVLKEMEPTPWNKFYRTASLQNNMSGVYSIQGNQGAAIQEMKACVDNLRQFLKEDNIKDVNRQYAREFLYQAMDNYARLLKEVGDYNKAKEIITYAYRLKKKHLNEYSPEISKSKVLIGQINLDLREYNAAITILEESIAEFENNESPYNHWLAMAYYYKGQANRFLEQIDVAKMCFEKSNVYFKKSLGEYYDEIYLDFIINASSFYAQHGDSEKAIAMANEAYDYILENQGEKTLLEYYQVLNLAEIHYNLNHFDKALTYSNNALQVLKDSSFIEQNDLSRLRIEVLKPDALLTKIKVEYQLENERTVDFLKLKLEQLQDAISIIEKQKAVLSDDGSLSILLQNHNNLFELAKQIAIELYKKTDSQQYVNKVLNLHESMLYNRIRNRLNSQASIAFANIPDTVLEKEAELKANLNATVSESNDLDRYIKSQTEWNAFLELLKKEYPKYYNLRYAFISKSTQDVATKIPKNKTLVRYAFVQSKLYAFIIDDTKTELFELDTTDLNKFLLQLQRKNTVLEYDFEVLHKLYNVLWRPFENTIDTEGVIIIPDRSLFNLNFELLTPEPIDSYQEMATKSLLSKHSISYNYSLLLVDNNSKSIGYDSNFIAFAPEFNSQMKTKYKLVVTDSLNVDHGYLTLLPQPSTKYLAKVSSRLFDGTSFLNENASKHLFTSNAKEHKIIHIGTHAESNNISPELSRLIFAKNVSDSISTNDNSLYTYEIYNQNLSSNLAILTACETGKPTYQAGEGMISLAHAFNYAGSESILTSLWKIDETSSADIVMRFYKNISAGMAKDLALKRAKLDYISSARGRTANPQYWAGLILIGDTSPIDLKVSSSNTWYWVIGILLLLFLVLLVVTRSKKPS